MTTYEDIYNIALSKITDPTLAQMPEEDLCDLLHGYLMSSVAKFRKCKSDLSDRDEISGFFKEDLTDIEIEILAIMMVREWIGQRIYSITNVLQVFTGKEAKYYSQA